MATTVVALPTGLCFLQQQILLRLVVAAVVVAAVVPHVTRPQQAPVVLQAEEARPRVGLLFRCKHGDQLRSDSSFVVDVVVRVGRQSDPVLSRPQVENVATRAARAGRRRNQDLVPHPARYNHQC
jgi:hypothetical protein